MLTTFFVHIMCAICNTAVIASCIKIYAAHLADAAAVAVVKEPEGEVVASQIDIDLHHFYVCLYYYSHAGVDFASPCCCYYSVYYSPHYYSY